MSCARIDQVLTIKVPEPHSFFIAMCCRCDGCYMVINGGTNKILVYSEAGALLQSNFGNSLFSKRITTPSLIAELNDKTLAVFDKSTNQVKKMSKNEELLKTFEIGMPTHSLNVNHYGHMIMAHTGSGNKRIVSIRDAATGFVLHFLEIPTHPYSNPDGPFYSIYQLPSNILTLDQSSCTIAQHLLDGTVQYNVSKQGFLQGNLHNPSSICADIKGNVIVADTRNDRVVRFMGDNMKYSETLISDVYRPLYVSIDKHDHLLILTSKHILIYDYDIRAPLLFGNVPALIDGLL
ncbi:uncharacterized protein [Watersipora subatra]|uniref:uncharacterized protein n=1 Tax=Watersipora subatra TaxID=2589382 RepID=UPI00355AF945